MLLSICAIMVGEESFSGMADQAEIHKVVFEKYFDLKDCRTPSNDTFDRLYNSFDSEKFNACFMQFTKPIAKYCQIKEIPNKVKHIAIDGKTLRNSGDRSFHIVNAWAQNIV